MQHMMEQQYRASLEQRKEAQRVAAERAALEAEARNLQAHQHYLSNLEQRTKQEAERVAAERSALEARAQTLASKERRITPEATKQMSMAPWAPTDSWTEDHPTIIMRPDRLAKRPSGSGPAHPQNWEWWDEREQERHDRTPPSYPDPNLYRYFDAGNGDQVPTPDEPPLLSLLREDLPALGLQDFGASGAAASFWSPTLFTQSLANPLIELKPFAGTDQAAHTFLPEHVAKLPEKQGSQSNKRSQPPVDDETASRMIAEEIYTRQCTTLMIRNLPNKLTPPMIMECVHELGFEYEYDYLFVPVDTNAPGWANRNLGYCFVNLSSPDVAMRFCRKAYGYCFRQAVSSTKSSKISIAEEQGVLKNLHRIDRASPRKEQRAGKHCSHPYVRIDGKMQAIPPAEALAILEG